MILRDAVIALGLKISGSVLWLAYSIVIARTLSQDDFGRLFYIINIVLLAGPVCGLGFENSVLRYGSRYWAAMQQGTFRALITQSRLYGLLGGAVLSLAIIVAFAAGFDNPLTHRATTVAGAVAAIGLYTVMCVHRDLLRSAGYLIRSQIGINITRAIVPLALSLALSALGWLSLDTALFSYVARARPLGPFGVLLFLADSDGGRRPTAAKTASTCWWRCASGPATFSTHCSRAPTCWCWARW